MRTRIPAVVLGAALLATVTACGSSQQPNHPAAAPAAAPAIQGVQVQTAESSLGQILVDQNGRTLYAFTNDKGGASNCTGQCIATWPALVSRQPAQPGPGVNRLLLAETTRAEGTTQATYGAWPLYYYAGDIGPGDVDGQGVDGVWFVVGADGKLIKTTS